MKRASKRIDEIYVKKYCLKNENRYFIDVAMFFLLRLTMKARGWLPKPIYNKTDCARACVCVCARACVCE